jgi:hypothetical protein
MTRREQIRPQRFLVSLLVVSTVAVLGGIVERVHVTTDLATAHTELRDAGNDLADATTELQQTQSAIDDAVENRDDDQARADHIVAATLQLLQMRDQLDSATAELATTENQVDATVHQAGILASCLETLDSTRRHLENGDASSARAALASGSATCQQADDIASGSDGAVYPFDFADPFILVDGGHYYAFGTNGGAGQVQVLSSNDEHHWQIAGNALPALPAWAQPGQTWSPSVMRTASGFVLYYSARERSSDKQCIGAAVSTAPQGPYLDPSSTPLICQTDLGGSIDPSPYTDPDGNSYLVWKSENETVGGVSQLWAQQLGPDAGSLVGDPVVLAVADRTWEGKVIEGPSMAMVGGTWMLLYFGNSWGGGQYAVGDAVCAGPLGPCPKPADNVVLRSSNGFAGPGGAEFFTDSRGGLAIVFAAWDADQIGYPNPRRMHVAAVGHTAGNTLTIRP